MENLKRILVLPLTVGLAGSMLLSPIIKAVEGESAIVTIEQEVSYFNVIVPSVLPIKVDKFGNAIIATDATIVNNSYGPVRVASVSIQPKSDWQIADFNEDYHTKKFNQKEFGFQINGSQTREGETALDVSSWGDIQKGNPLSIVYTINIPPQKIAITGEMIADVVLIVGWSESDNNKESEQSIPDGL